MPPSHNQWMAEPGFKHRLFVLNPVLFKPDYIWHIFLKYASPKDLWCPRIVIVDKGLWNLDWLISGCLLWTWHQYTFSLLREKSCNIFFFNLAIVSSPSLLIPIIWRDWCASALSWALGSCLSSAGTVPRSLHTLCLEMVAVLNLSTPFQLPVVSLLLNMLNLIRLWLLAPCFFACHSVG